MIRFDNNVGWGVWFFLLASGWVWQAQATPWPRTMWPDWAEKRSIDQLYEDPQWAQIESKVTAEAAFHRVLYDTHVWLGNNENEQGLFREVMLLHNEQGLDMAGDLAVTYAPDDEALLLVHLRRRGAGETHWQDLRFHVQVEREGKIEGMYVDERTVAFIPARLAPGDLVDFAYIRVRRRSTIGPWDWYETDGYGMHVSSRKLVIEGPEELGLRGFVRGFDKPQVVEKKGRRRFEWQFEHVSPPAVEERLPFDYDPFSAVLVTTATDWQQLGDTYVDIIDQIPIHDEIAGFARALVADGREPVEALASWVQENIRYVGLEISIHRMVPAPPEETMERGYGDCKDMSLLLVHMLRSVGVQAWPALVRTGDLGPVDERLPSLSVFNHEIVAVQRGDGLLFIDPTVKEAVPPWAGAARKGQMVLLAARGRGLVEVGQQPNALDKVEAYAEADLVTNGSTETKLMLDVSTRYSGPGLISMRRRLLEGQPETLRSDAARFFGRATGGLLLVSMEHDYSAASKTSTPLEIRESMVFAGQAMPGAWALRYLPPEIGEWFDLPTVAGRKSPLGLDHPRQTQVRLVVKDAGVHDFKPLTDWGFFNDFVEINRTHEWTDRGLETTWTATTKQDIVPVEHVADFATRMEAARVAAELVLWPNGIKSHTTLLTTDNPWRLALSALLGFVFGIVVAGAYFRRRR